VQNYFTGSQYKIEKVVFDDGTVWDGTVLDAAQILPTGASLTATTGNDLIDLRNVANTTAYGGGGDDTYLVDSANDVPSENLNSGTDSVHSSVNYTLGANIENLSLTGIAAINGTGNALNNVIKGNASANTLTGGAGADMLEGGDGDDTYHFSLGDGADIIVDSNGNDQITLGQGISDADVTVSRAAGIVKLAYSATDSIGFVETSPGEYAVESVVFSGGVIWTAADLTQKLSSFNDAPTGSVNVSGIAKQNQTLTAANTLADADGLGIIAYQWQTSTDGAIWTDVVGATSNYFNLAEAQVGQQVRVNASYTDGHGTLERVSSAAIAAVTNVNDAPTGSVTISGAAAQNQTLTAMNTLVDSDGLGTINYQWKANGVNIVGATSSTFNMLEALVGKNITVAASYTDGHGTFESIDSSATTAVANVNDAPTGAITISGT
ncbi:calcium-binding protein, partial [Sideroxyarcus sp. TK5]